MPLNSESLIETVPSKGGEAERHIPLLGDEYLLVEFGEMSTDFFYNLRAKAFAERTEEARKGIAFP